MTAGIVSLYVISIIIVIFMVDWNTINNTISPFVQKFDKMGYDWASVLVNFVILIATFSVMIGNFYGYDQMLVSLAEAMEAPKILTKTSMSKWLEHRKGVRFRESHPNY
jgi:L-asparagine transporter-like permease